MLPIIPSVSRDSKATSDSLLAISMLCISEPFYYDDYYCILEPLPKIWNLCP